MKTKNFMDSLNTARIQSVKEEKANKNSKLAKLYAEKEAANNAYKKAERDFLFAKGSTYAAAQRNIVRSAFRSYLMDITHSSKECECVMTWYDTNNIDKEQGIIDTEYKLQSYCKSTYDNYKRGMLDVSRKTKEEREREKAEKLALVTKLASLSNEELTKLLESAK